MSTALKPDFGAYKPTGLSSFILTISRAGLGRGKIKKRLSKAFQHKNKNRPVDITYHGIKMRLQPTLNTIESKILFSPKLREATELEYLKKSIKDGGTFLDIGANFGYYSFMAVKMGASKILSVEPNPNLQKRLNEIAALNGYDSTIDCVNKGLGKKDGTLELTINNQDLGSSSMIKTDMPGEKVSIPITTLEHLLTEKKIAQIDAIKIDVEGMEDRILFPFFENAPQELFPKLIIIEENNDLWERDILKWLLSTHYQTIKKTNGNFILKTV